jgi:hypothetical protein
MSNSSSGSDPFSTALGNAGGALGSFGPAEKDPEFHMKYSSVRKLGKNVGDYAPSMQSLSDKTRAIDMHTFTFGLIGGGLNVAHRSVRDAAADAFAQGKEVLESWRQAINDIATNGETAEEASKINRKVGGGLNGGGIKTPMTPEMPGSFDTDMPEGFGMPTPDPNALDPQGGRDLDDIGADIPDPNDPNLQIPDPNDPNLQNPGLNDPNLQNPGINDPNLQNPGLNDPNLQNPALNNPALNNPELNNPDLKGINQPSPTDLAGIDRNLANQIPQARMPDATAFDPRATNGMPRTSLYPEGGVGFGGSGGGAAGGTPPPGSISRALNSGMPIYPPPMGGAAAGNREEKTGESGPYLSEDESTWGFDEEAGPAVIRSEEE